MLTTFYQNQFPVHVDGTTVSVGPGTGRIGNALMGWDGTRIPYGDVVTFTGDASTYRNSLLYLQAPTGYPDMTRALSDETTSLPALGVPEMPPADTSGWSDGLAVGLFTFFTPDGATPELVSYRTQ